MIKQPTTTHPAPFLNGKRGQLFRSLNQLLVAHNKYDASSLKRISSVTQRDRERILSKFCRDVHELGYKIVDVHQIRTRHVQAVIKKWEADQISGSTLANRLSCLNTLCTWINKPGMLKSPANLVTDPASLKRKYYAVTDKTWSGKSVDIEAKIAQVEGLDPYVGLQLRLQWAFGLRAQESWMLRPVMADRGTHIDVKWGTKGGRARTVPMETEGQRKALDQAKSMSNPKNGSIIPQQYNLSQWENHYYYVVRSAGLTREEGITSHGLRHEKANEWYKAQTGHPSLIAGGNIQDVKYAVDDAARRDISERLGHSRKPISGAYLGSRIKKSAPA